MQGEVTKRTEMTNPMFFPFGIPQKSIRNVSRATPPKTKMAMEHLEFEDAFPIGNQKKSSLPCWFSGGAKCTKTDALKKAFPSLNP